MTVKFKTGRELLLKIANDELDRLAREAVILSADHKRLMTEHQKGCELYADISFTSKSKEFWGVGSRLRKRDLKKPMPKELKDISDRLCETEMNYHNLQTDVMWLELQNKSSKGKA